MVTSGDHSKRTVTSGTDKDKDYEKEKDKDYEKDMIGGTATPNDTADRIVSMFFDLYKSYTGMEHPRIISTSDFKEKVIDRIFWVGDSYGDNVIEYAVDDPEELIRFYEWSIIRYLERFADSGMCSIFHFFSGDIRLMRFYDYEKEEL